uniref:Cyclin-like domain-containing protein n=1 Tax=Strigamia maritima TaxID=126957 RepID=T1IGW1_STRMM
MDQLYCPEATHEIETNRARADRVLFDDYRIVPNLLTCERKYHPTCDYLVKVQTDIKQHMRREVATWMLEVCEERGCEEVVFPLSVNLMDRFLSIVNIHRSQLQLLASVCLLAASKLRQTRSFSVEQLCYYTDHSITPEELISWELLVLTKLGWDLGSIVATDFVDYTLHSLQKHAKLGSRVRQHAFTFISLCAIGGGKNQVLHETRPGKRYSCEYKG